MQKDNGERRESLGDKKRPNESQKVWGPIFIGDQNPRDPKRQSSGDIARSDTSPDKAPWWKQPSCKHLTCVSPTLGDSKGQFQLVHPCPDISTRAEWGIVGALSHVSTHKYFHASIHVASPQLGHLSILHHYSDNLRGIQRHPFRTICSTEAAHISLIASNLL